MADTNNERPGCLGLLFRLFAAGAKPQPSSGDRPLPFNLRDDFLSPAELSFYHVLVAAVGPDYVVCPKVGLADIFFVSQPHKNQGDRGRIAQKHVDFLLCSQGPMRPVLGIELDDISHSRRDRQVRDEFVEAVFRAAKLPLLRFPVQTAYELANTRTQLMQHLNVSPASPDVGEPTAPPESPAPLAGSAPQCPKCSIPMVLRTASRGERHGQQFYGCPNYPRCRETVPVPGNAESPSRQ
jgi:hypothetical protein